MTKEILNLKFEVALCLLLLLCGSSLGLGSERSPSTPDLETILAARQDLWGLEAIRQPGGPSFDFFARLLPPLRYVNTEFRHYPIVLSAPNASGKARLVSNGSSLNARANAKGWHDFGVPVTFRVGEDAAAFGAEVDKLDGPHLERGYLPVVRLSYEHGGSTYREESFATVDPTLSSNGIVFVRFTVAQGRQGLVSAQFDPDATLEEDRNSLLTTNGLAVAVFDRAWKWRPERKTLEARLRRGAAISLAIASKPIASSVPLPGAGEARHPTAPRSFPWYSYEKQHERCLKEWQSLLDRGTQIEVPEPLVNNAWRALVAGLFTLVNGDRLNYSAGNGYERQYEAECGDAVRALLLFGFADDARRLQLPLLDYVQQGLRYHDAAFKLQMLSHYFWLTRDTDFISATRKQWQRETGYIVDGREAATGLLPREDYCGDIKTPVYSLNSCANSWRGVRDFAAVLEALGDSTTAKPLQDAAEAFRRSIRSGVEQSERRDVQPTFIPIALFGEEKPYDRLTDTQLGSYWCLMAPYVLGSGVFGPRSERERAMVDYLQEHGGVSMGLIRFHQHSGLYANDDALDDLYGLRYTVKLLELDEVDRALVSFYGKLAQGLTRDTFYGAEGTGLRPLDTAGRPMFKPPNSSAQAYFLWMLRYLLVQDWDLDDNGAPETLGLCFATPKRWLEDGKTLKVERAPTAFGELSLKISSRLSQGEVLASLELPTRNAPRQTFLRIRVPAGWRVVSGKAGKLELNVDERGTADISALKGKSTVRFKVEAKER